MLKRVFAVCGLLLTMQVSAEVTIYRDAWGAPHIYGPTDASVAYGFLYAQAEDNFWQIEDTIIQALGRYAEVMGETALAADYLNRALRIADLSRVEWQGLDPATRALTEAAAQGLNQYLADSGTTPRLIKKFEPWHFVAASRFSTYQLFVFNRARIKNDEVAAFAGQLKLAQHFAAGSLALAARNAVADAQAHAGSNTWAIAPSRTKGGAAMLFVNPHQPFFGPGQWYEGHLHSAEGLHFSGAGFFASPLPTIGHNGKLGWSHTVNEPDTVDVYQLTVDDATALAHYIYEGERKPLQRWTDTITVATEQGPEVRRFSFLASHHGPVVARRDDKLLAVRMAMFVEGGQLQQRYDMLRAQNLEEFKAALAQLATPMFNTMYADAAGNIYYAYYGAVPRRDPQFDWTQPVSGSTAATEWQGYHPLAELPTYTNPPSGYLQNCNATPFLATADGENLNAADFPKYMAPEPDNNRSRMSRILLSGDKQFSFADLREITWDTYVLEAETTVPMLAQEIAARDLKAADLRMVEPALQMLQAWDRQATVASTATTLYFFWRNLQVRGGVADSVQAFKQAVGYMHQTYGGVEVPWGDVNRLQRAHTSGRAGFDDAAESLPVAGGPGNPFGTIFNFYARPQPGQKRMYGVAGHSYVALVEFAAQPRAESILQFGASADPASPHYFDQGRLYAQQRYKPAWFDKAAVQAGAKLSRTLAYP